MAITLSTSQVNTLNTRAAAEITIAFGKEPGPPAYGAAIIAATPNEVSHHGTQVCMLRDLYRITDGRMLSTGR